METYIQMKNGSVYATAIFFDDEKQLTTQMQMEQRNSYAVLSTGFEGSTYNISHKTGIDLHNVGKASYVKFRLYDIRA